MPKIINGLSQILVAEPTANGTLPADADFTKLCDTLRDSVKFNESEPSTETEYSDQDDAPIASFSEKGLMTVSFSTYDWDNDVLVALKGGTITNGKWHASTSRTNIVKAFRIVTDSGAIISFPRLKINCFFNAEFKKKNVSLLEVKCEVLAAMGNSSVIIS